MTLPGYGLLIGKITGSRPKRRGSPHWLLIVQPGDPKHPPYRVAVNLQDTEAGHPAELQYNIVDFGGRGRRAKAGNAMLRRLMKLQPTPSFVTADSDPSLPRMDFVRGGLFDTDDFEDFTVGPDSLQSAFEEAVKAAQDAGAAVAVFGTGYPIDQVAGRSVPTGFTGIENIHMNQGALNQINGPPHFVENGANQDGGIIFLFADGAKGFFVKFRTQTTSTDADGNPTITGIDDIDKTSAAVRKAIMPPIRRRAMAARRSDARTSAKHAAKTSAVSTTAGRAVTSPVKTNPAKTNPSGTANERGYVFADFDPNDSSGKYVPDNDTDTYQTPFVQQLSKGQTRGPVPTSRVYPRLDLTTIVGSNPPGYASTSAGKSIAFDIVGDSGAPSQQKLDEYEVKVTDLMTSYASQSPPTFLFHVGDVVYFYGEENYYYSQFYEPFKAYPAPIFAIPGNHDAITYNASMVSLDSFQKAFCAAKPGRWEGSGGILRSTMTQPGVYFTLDHPLVSIIGLYSNCGESLGWLNDAQLMFLYQELVRLKAARAGGIPAVILAIHHFPRWFPGQKDPNSTAIDATCKKAGFWPDAVICGHAHLYQRVVRHDTGQDIPYLVVGAGGYAITPGQEEGKTYMAQLMKNSTRLASTMFESGFARATLTSPANGDPTLRFEYRSVKPKSNGPDDVCTVNLRTNKLM